MCGIFTLLNNTGCLLPQDFVKKQFEKGRGRGPENSVLKNVMIKADFGFHRLAINGLDDVSNQPIIIDQIALICNGEIYNYRELYKEMNIKPKTNSDCEVIIHLYKLYGIEHTLQMLDGVFSFVLIDYSLNNSNSKIYIARDPYGVRPLYCLYPDNSAKFTNDDICFQSIVSQEIHNPNTEYLYGFASELKMISDIANVLNQSVEKKRANEKVNRDIPYYKIKQFTPGSYSEFVFEYKVNSSWELKRHNVFYHTTGFNSSLSTKFFSDFIANIQIHLVNAVNKRCITTERPIACLLSGGLDSSLIAGLVNDFHLKNKLPRLETYSIGLAGSEDLRYAKIVANYLGTKHTEVVVTEEDFLAAIPEVINAIESYDTTTVRASIGNWLLGKYISENSQAKVIFNGDGSDELAGGYLYMNYAPDNIEFDKECRRLLKDIHTFDVLRSDKSISSHGLEPRTPFLDRSWVQYYLTIPASLRFHKNSANMEKYLIRTAFSFENYKNYSGESLLPAEVLMRRKEAFSDGVSQTSRSLFEIIKEYTDRWFLDKEYYKFDFMPQSPDMYEKMAKISQEMYTDDHLLPKTSEQYYYRKIFESHFKGMGKIIPYFWMPKYVDAKDASARTLLIYKGNQG
uniref:asparagine synthase (glutamine-hydrolyzing) n=1 Tax=viral metagenome TaxID=1070528 RepID=A0A6C0JGN8_9ZZZZ